jgi:hypothetical protein
MRREDRFRDRLRDRFRDRFRVRLRFHRGSSRSRALSCTEAVFLAGSLCDISMPGCNYPSSSQASDHATAPAATAGSLAVASLPGALPFALVAACGAGARPVRPLLRIPVTLPVAVSVAHRVVAGRRLLLACSRRSCLAVSLAELAVAIAIVVAIAVAVAVAGRSVSGRRAQPSWLRWRVGGLGRLRAEWRRARALGVGPRGVARAGASGRVVEALCRRGGGVL